MGGSHGHDRNTAAVIVIVAPVIIIARAVGNFRRIIFRRVNQFPAAEKGGFFTGAHNHGRMLHNVCAFFLAQAAHNHLDIRVTPHAAQSDDAGSAAGNIGRIRTSGGSAAFYHAVNAIFRKNLVAGTQAAHHSCGSDGPGYIGGAVQHGIVIVIFIGSRAAHEPLGRVQVQIDDPVKAQFLQVRLIDFQKGRADHHLEGLFRSPGRYQLLQHAQISGRAMEKKSGVARVVFNETAFREFHPHGSQRLLRIHPFQGHAGRTGITGTEGI